MSQSALTALSIDDPIVRKEICLALAERKKDLEKAKKDLEKLGLSPEATYDRLKLHGPDGIHRFFVDSTEGLEMFTPVWPLKSVEDDSEVDNIVLPSEEEAITWIMAFLTGPDIGSPEKPLPEMRWIDGNGKLYQLGIRSTLDAVLSPISVLAEDPPIEVERPLTSIPLDINEERRRLAIQSVHDAGAMTVQIRDRVVAYIGSLEVGTPVFQEFVDSWLDGDVSLDMKPVPPVGWVPPEKDVDVTAERFAEIEAWALSHSVPVPTRKILAMLLESEMPLEFLPETGSGAGCRLKMVDIEDATSRWVSSVGS